MKKLRIRKADSLNWVIEIFEPGGEIATRGRTAGKPKAERWTILGHYNSLKNASKSIIDDIIADELGNNYASGKQILQAIELAEKRIIEEILPLVKNDE